MQMHHVSINRNAQNDNTKISELGDHAKAQQLRNKGGNSQSIGLTNKGV